MTIDEIEAMCREEIADPVTGTVQRDYRGSMRAYNLARALLLLLPVVRAAEEWRKTYDVRQRPTIGPQGGRLMVQVLPNVDKALAVIDSIDTLHPHTKASR